MWILSSSGHCCVVTFFWPSRTKCASTGSSLMFPWLNLKENQLVPVSAPWGSEIPELQKKWASMGCIWQIYNLSEMHPKTGLSIAMLDYKRLHIDCWWSHHIPCQTDAWLPICQCWMVSGHDSQFETPFHIPLKHRFPLSPWTRVE